MLYWQKGGGTAIFPQEGGDCFKRGGDPPSMPNFFWKDSLKTHFLKFSSQNAKKFCLRRYFISKAGSLCLICILYVQYHQLYHLSYIMKSLFLYWAECRWALWGQNVILKNHQWPLICSEKWCNGMGDRPFLRRGGMPRRGGSFKKGGIRPLSALWIFTHITCLFFKKEKLKKV